MKKKARTFIIQGKVIMKTENKILLMLFFYVTLLFALPTFGQDTIVIPATPCQIINLPDSIVYNPAVIDGPDDYFYVPAGCGQTVNLQCNIVNNTDSLIYLWTSGFPVDFVLGDTIFTGFITNGSLTLNVDSEGYTLYGIWDVTKQCYSQANNINPYFIYFGFSALPAVLTQNICSVGFDTTAGFNKIIWEQVNSGITDYYLIYRDGSLIGSVKNDSLSEYVDTGVNPAVASHTYQIAIQDTCGGINAMDNGSTSILLVVSRGQNAGQWNLQWNPLISNGTTISADSTYIIAKKYPADNTWSFIGYGTSGIPDYNFIDDDTTTGVTYAILVNSSCTPDRSIDYIFSNPVTPNLSTGITSIKQNTFGVYPNPTTGIIHLPAKNMHIIVSDLTGRVVSETISSALTIDISNLAAGVYFIRDAGTNSTSKVIKQ